MRCPLGVQLILVQLCNAIIPVLLIFGFLLCQLRHHLINGLLHLGEGIQTSLACHSSELRAMSSASRLFENLHSSGPRTCKAMSLRHLQESWIECPAEGVMSLIRTKNLNSLCNGRQLLLADTLSILPLLVCGSATLLQVQQERIVLRDGVLRKLEILCGCCMKLIALSQLPLFLVDGCGDGGNFCLLRSLDVLIFRLVIHFLLLGFRQVGLEGLQHLLQDAIDFARLWHVVLSECGRGCRGILLGKREHHPALLRGDPALQEMLMPLHLHPHHLQGAGDLGVLGQQGRGLPRLVMLAKNHNRSLQGLDGLDEVLLFRVELLGCLFSNARCLT
mmetsp:Transcript_43411/g.102249  ORF Transcript_43411/g.102249 Transcript_43411/m.102249 type:complete len:333 (+) Transcript_43411:835-1833(+)